MPNLINKIVVKELDSELKGAGGMLLVSFAGLTVLETEALRGAMAAKGVGFRMVRNKLARRVLSEYGLEFGAEAFQGNTAIAYGDAEAAIEAAKILTDKDVKKVGKVSLKAGLIDGDILGADDATALADVPDKDTLRAQLLGVIGGPARGLVTCLNANQSGLARVLQGRADKLEESA